MSHFVVMDLEMCSLHKERINDEDLYNEIIQIGAILLDDQYDYIDSFMTYVKPEIGYVDKYINELTGISDSNLIDAPLLEDALYQFMKWIPKGSKIVTWSENDEYQLRNEMMNKEIEIDEFDVYFNDFIDCQKLFTDKVGRDKNYKLSEALCISDIDSVKGEHDALVDAKNTAKLFKKLNKEDKFQFRNDYMPANDIKRSSYNPFLELLAGIKVK